MRGDWRVRDGMGWLPQFDKNTAFIWASYGVGAAMILLSALGVWLRARASKRALERLEREPS